MMFISFSSVLLIYILTTPFQYGNNILRIENTRGIGEMYMKRAISIITAGIIIFTNIPYSYTHPQNLASRSQFKLWEEKGINPQIGLIIEERERAIHKGILRGDHDASMLQAIDAEAVRGISKNPDEFLRQHPFDYRIIHFKDNIAFGIRANIYKDRYGEQQLILFYDPDNPPWDLLADNGVKTSEDREFAKRGYWITSIETHNPTRRALLKAVVAILGAGSLLPLSCVFDTSGLPPPKQQDGRTTDAGATDAGTTDAGTTDAGTTIDNTIKQSIDAVIDDTNNPVTILQTSPFSSEDTTYYLSLLPQFVRDNNLAFRYDGSNWHWTLSAEDRSDIIDNGFTYIFNGRNHKVKLIGRDNNGQTKTIVFNPQIPGIPNYTQPYRLSITPEQIQELAEQIDLDLNTLDIHFENLEPEQPFILNGLALSPYTVVTQSGEIDPDLIVPMGLAQWTDFYSATSGQEPDEQEWVRDGGDYASISDGILTIDTVAPGGEIMCRYHKGTFNNETGTTVEWRLSVGEVNGIESLNVRINDGTKGEIYFFTPTSVQPNYYVPENAGISYPIDTTVPHNYRATLQGDIAKLYIDGILVMTSTPFDIADNELYFGDSTLTPGENSVSSWDYIGYSDRGAFNPQYDITTIQSGDANVSIDNVDNQTIRFHYSEINVGVEDDKAGFTVNIPTESNNLLALYPDGLRFNIKGNGGAIIEFINPLGESVGKAYIVGLHPETYRSVIIDLADILPLDELAISQIRFYVDGTSVEESEGDIYFQGPVGTPPGGTRLGYATDDPDLEPGLTQELINRLKDAKREILETRNGVTIVGVTEWPGVLEENGLYFKIGDKHISAFNVKETRTIYVPHPGLIESKTKRISASVKKRYDIVIRHELQELSSIDHQEVVLNEYEDNINGLNTADIITVLLEVLIGQGIENIDNSFHSKFIEALLLQGMNLTENTHVRIVHELIDNTIPEADIRAIYQQELTRIDGLATSFVRNIGFSHKPISSEKLYLDDAKLASEEIGFRELLTLLSDEEFIRQVTESGIRKTIYIDLDRFFIRNDSLSDAVTIDYESLKRLVKLIQLIRTNEQLRTYIHIAGLTDKTQDDILIHQLVNIILRDHLPEDIFPVRYNIDFSNYTRDVVGEENIEDTVSILSNSSITKIPDYSSLKIITPALQEYNRTPSLGYEFQLALKGLYQTKDEFIKSIIAIADNILTDLVNRKLITEDKKQEILSEIRQKGIGFIPAYFNPILYYKTIDTQKALLIAA